MWNVYEAPGTRTMPAAFARWARFTFEQCTTVPLHSSVAKSFAQMVTVASLASWETGAGVESSTSVIVPGTVPSFFAVMAFATLKADPTGLIAGRVSEAGVLVVAVAVWP